ncbi:putative E3 ubiquitin-protein ligase XBOS33 isoform X1 [Iris pallida]|uniref:E3 ubiquitin-protein ligase XBOS33 isoform X1 n=1 Tax=Iris pallida TaxID=29817 RepID=A0AAX6GDR2_IRIPA|nr:putative E3 ubiquitin-protein ligase XBOS33 isoform X1 [Iris pallida]
MGNSLRCSASGERLASAARDGDIEEARALLELNPRLATYSTFAASNSPLHFASSKGHTEIVSLLLENGANANSRNFCGQTALMLACRRGHWEVVLTLLIFRSSVTTAEYLSGKTALHFAAARGHIRCIRLLAADFVPGTHCGAVGSPESTPGINSCVLALSRFVNKVADGGVTALHLAALNGDSDCVQLLADLRADVSAVTYHYGPSTKMIGRFRSFLISQTDRSSVELLIHHMMFAGPGSTPLHFAASGGNLKCCEAKSFLPEVLVG